MVYYYVYDFNTISKWFLNLIPSSPNTDFIVVKVRGRKTVRETSKKRYPHTEHIFIVNTTTNVIFFLSIVEIRGDLIVYGLEVKTSGSSLS